jgi:hypothetical protein
MNLAPIDLVSAHRWERVTFTTYALSLSFFEAVVLDALIRGGARQALILADVQGVRASLSEQGAQRVGKDYNVEPVAVSSGRAFHPKISVFADKDESHVLVGSGNLTFNGWGGNVEVLEHLHPSFAADAVADTAEFFELLPLTERVRFGAEDDCAAIAADLRRSVQGEPANGNIRLLHNLDKSISSQLLQMVESLGGATRLIAAAPFWDQGAAIDTLCKAIGLDHLYIHSHAHGTVEGTAGSNWPFNCRSKVHPILLEVMDGAGNRRLHAKAFEVMCEQGRILISGSANGTAAALEEGGNVEACVVRIQRDSPQGWKFKPSEPPEPLAALDEGNEEEEENRGVLRALLDGDEIQGEILTPAMSGAVSVSYISNLAPEPLGKVMLSADRRFRICAASLEKKSWQAGRLVIRVEDQQGRLAEGFVSVASFADISKRAGIVTRRLMAVLNGTETPADVAAIMSWFYEDPNRLADAAGPQAMGGGGKESATPKTAEDVVVADLSRTGMAAAAALAAAGKDANANWSRFMGQIFAAFREKRGPFGRTGASGKGDDDRDDAERDRDDGDAADDGRYDDDQGDGKPEPDVDDPAIERSLVAFEKLFELMLKPGAAVRHVVMAFDLGHYICERLRPDVAQATRWLEKLIPAVLKAGVPAERRSDVAASVLALLSASPTPAKLRWARGCLLRLEIDPSGAPPAGAGGQGFQSVLPQTKTRDELWPQLQEIRTPAEQVRTYIAALNNGSTDGDFTELAKGAEEAWSVLSQALKTKNASKVIVLKKATEYCPRHQIGLPTGEVAKLHSLGIGVAKNCCGSVLLWPGD